MGKLLTGRYGEMPEAESAMSLTLSDCRTRLSLKPTDHVSVGEPDFFRKTFGTKGRYLVFQVPASEVQSNPVWKEGYYLLPMEAAEVLRVFQRNQGPSGSTGARVLPVTIDSKDSPAEDVMARAKLFAQNSQPLFFKCKCDHLEMKIAAPWGLRRRWRARLSCPDRCQPVLSALF